MCETVCNVLSAAQKIKLWNGFVNDAGETKDSKRLIEKEFAQIID